MHSGGTIARGTRTLVRIACAAIATVATTIALASVSAAPASADTTMGAEAVAPIAPLTGGSIPVIVTLKSDRLVDGVLSVADGGFGVSGSPMAVQVAGGTEKQLVFLAQVQTGMGGMATVGDADLQVRLVFTVDGAVAAERTVQVPTDAWVEPVGVLPALAEASPPPASSPLRFEAGTASLRTIPASVLAAGAGALDPFGTIVGAADDLARLDEGQRRTVLDWVAHGGHLLVDADAAPVDGLPDAWQPRSGWAVAGAGEVRLAHGAAGRGEWETLLEPTAAELGNRQLQGSQLSVPVGPISLTADLASDSGFRMPDFSVLLLVLAAYVVVVGPVVFVILAKSRRRMRFWTVVPALALLTSGGLVVAGGRLRSDTDSAQATVIEETAAGSSGRLNALIGSAGGGGVDLRYPAGWRGDLPPADMNGGMVFGVGGDFGSFGGGGFGFSGASNSGSTRLTPVVSSADASRSRLELDPGEYEIVAASGPVVAGSGLAVDAAFTDGSLAGTVTNRSSAALTDVVVLNDDLAIKVGDLAAGASVAFDADDAARGALPEQALWDLRSDVGNVGGMSTGMAIGMPVPTMAGAFISCVDSGDGRGEVCTTGAGPAIDGAEGSDVVSPLNPRMLAAGQDNPVSGAAWLAYVQGAGRSLRSPDQITVVGWSGGAAELLSVDGRGPVDRGRTAHVLRANARIDGDLRTGGVRIERVRGTDLRTTRGPGADLAVNGPLTRVLLPPTIDDEELDPSTVVVSFPRQVTRAQVWVGNGWRLVTADGGARLRLRLSADSVRDGVVYLRTGFGEEFLQPGLGAAAGRGWAVDAGGDVDLTTVVDGPELTADEVLAKQDEEDRQRALTSRSTPPTSPTGSAPVTVPVPAGTVVVPSVTTTTVSP